MGHCSFVVSDTPRRTRARLGDTPLLCDRLVVRRQVRFGIVKDFDSRLAVGEGAHPLLQPLPNHRRALFQITEAHARRNQT